MIAPSMIPRPRVTRVKTDAPDCRRLARLHQASELMTVRVPAPIEEAVWDLCSTRGDTRGSGMAGQGRSSSRRRKLLRRWRARDRSSTITRRG